MSPIHVRPQSIRLYLRLLFLSLACFSLSAHALDPATYAPTYSGNSVTLGNAISNAQNSSKFTLGVASAAGVATNTGMFITVPGGASVPVSVAGNVPMASAVGAIGRFLGKVIPVVSVGVGIYDLAKELGFTATKGSAGTVFQNDTPSIKPGVMYGGYGACSNPSTNCTQIAGGQPSGLIGPEGAPTACWVGTTSAIFYPYACTYTVGTSQTATVQQVLDAIAAKTDWSSTSALPRVISDAINSGEQVQVEPKTITGPATSPGVSSVTKDAVANTTTTATTTNNYQYAGNTVTTTQVTNNITTNNTTGAVTNNTSTTTTPKADAPTKSECEIHPTTIGCSEFGTPTSDTLKAKTFAVSIVADSFASSSACPAPLSFNVRAATYAVSYQPLCDRLIYLKALFLAMAAFLAAKILTDSFKV